MAKIRLALLLALPLLLASCLLSPGRFVSTLDIRKDRSFTFTYQGEVIAADMKTNDGKGGASKPVPLTDDQVAQRKGIAEALGKEQGYRSVEYVGGDKFRVDYALTGIL